MTNYKESDQNFDLNSMQVDHIAFVVIDACLVIVNFAICYVQVAKKMSKINKGIKRIIFGYQFIFVVQAIVSALMLYKLLQNKGDWEL